MRRAEREAPVAYLVPPLQHDLPAAATFIETLMRGAVDVDRAEAPFTADGREYPAGTWVVALDQPFRAFAKDLFEAQRYPDLRSSPGGKPIPPYDTAGWTLAFQMGVDGGRRCEAIRRAPGAARDVSNDDRRRPTRGAGRRRRARGGPTRSLRPRNNSAAVVNRLLAANVPR